MALLEYPVSGISRNLLDTDLQGEPLHIHISEVGANSRVHPSHKHTGYEAIYMLEGEGTFEIADEIYTLSANESVVFDPSKLHGLRNDSDQPMRYLVILYMDKT